MALAKRSGQPFTQMLAWHPRDVATLMHLYELEAEAAAEQAREERFAAATAELRRRMGE